VAEPEDATPEQLGRARSKIRAAGLNEDDAAAFLNALAAFREASDGIDAQIVEISNRSPIALPTSPDGLRIEELHRQRKTLVADIVSLLGARLSVAGMDKLYRHLQREKRGMKLIPMNLPSGN